MKQVAIVAALIASSVGCAHIKSASTTQVASNNPTTEIPGISGMARLDDRSFLTVHDAKVFEPEQTRVGLLTVDASAELLTFEPLEFPKDATTLSSDLESICRLPGRDREFLLSESGYWEGRHGRIFHVAMSGDDVLLKREVKLPLIRNNNEQQLDGDQFEGIACHARGDNDFIVIIGERGGTSVYPTGVIRWGIYDVALGTMEWFSSQMPVAAPNPWGDSRLRSITGLSIDDDDRLWASAALDAGDMGPFRSVIYLIGTVQAEAEFPVERSKEAYPRHIDGFKVEGLSASDSGSPMSIGTEDEALGGAWRELAN